MLLLKIKFNSTRTAAVSLSSAQQYWKTLIRNLKLYIYSPDVDDIALTVVGILDRKRETSTTVKKEVSHTEVTACSRAFGKRNVQILLFLVKCKWNKN